MSSSLTTDWGGLAGPMYELEPNEKSTKLVGPTNLLYIFKSLEDLFHADLSRFFIGFFVLGLSDHGATLGEVGQVHELAP